MSNDNFDTLDNLSTIQGDGGNENKLLADRYKVIRKLGEGGMGVVYLAEDTELNNLKVAIKFIPPMLAGNPRALKNLKREAQTSLTLSHPNIVRLHDLHTDGNQKFLVMEYIEDSYLIKNSQNYKDKGRVPPKMYNRGKELLKIEIEKIEHLPFKLISTGYSWGQDYQGLYSPLKDCIYLIDFGQISAIQKKNPL